MREIHTGLVCLLDEQAGKSSEQTALLGPGKLTLSYGNLYSLVTNTNCQLNGAGIRRGDRVALIISNGARAATAFLSIASGHVCAPLNPAYRASEFDFYFRDLQPKAVIIEAELDNAAAGVALSLGIPIFYLRAAPDAGAGGFTLDTGSPPAQAPDFAGADEVALVLHTSGTTSRPKIVPLTHANLLNNARNIAASLRLTADDRCLNVMPLFHVHGLIGAFLSSLTVGASVYCSAGFQATQFFPMFDECRPTWYTAVPTMHQAILARVAQSRPSLAESRLRLIRSCSSALPPQVMAELEEFFGVPVVEAYGMTEASHQMASNPLPPGKRKPGSVGIATGPEIAIMGPDGDLLPGMTPGEIVIRGTNVTHGYDNNPEANAAGFNQGWFLTGDQGYLDSEGYLFINGRTKEMINRGGEKITPREIDEALMEHPAVRQAVAFSLPDPRLGEDVGAAVVLRDGAETSESELRQFVSRKLADFKVPRRIVFVAEIPKGPTGKLQRIGLAEKLQVDVSPNMPEGAGNSSQPPNEIETLLQGIWSEVLKLRSVGIHDNFFDLGGDSLTAVQLIARVNDAAGVDLPVLDLFAMPTIAQMAGRITVAAAEPRKTVCTARDDEAGRPLSFAQERMWFLSQYEKDSAAYLRPWLLHLSGALNVAVLERSLTRILERHESLRTLVENRDGVPQQVIARNRPVRLDLTDFSGAADRESRLRRLVAAETREGIDLSRQIPFRAKLIKTGDREHFLLITTHHIASDGWSNGVFFNELTALYNAFSSGREPVLPKLDIQYADYAAWQNSRFHQGLLSEQIEWWKKFLTGAPPVLQLPVDRPRPPRQTFRGAWESCTIDAELTREIKTLGREEGATLFMSLFAGFNALVRRYTGAQDIVIGTPVANRLRIETEPLIGLFVNTLALRNDLSGTPSFRDVLRRVRETSLSAFAHQDAPFEKVVEVLHPRRNTAWSPLFQVMFQLRNLPVNSASVPGLQIAQWDCGNDAAQFELSLEICEEASGLVCRLNYNTDLFDSETVQGMLDHYRILLAAAVTQPETSIDHLPLLSAVERKRILRDSNQTDAAIPGQSVQELFEAQAKRTPHAVALSFGSTRISYQELHQRATRVASHLRAMGAGPGDLVGICAERSAATLAGILGALFSGAAYVPIDPEFPADRIRHMLNDSACRFLITDRKSAARLPKLQVETIYLDSFGMGVDWTDDKKRSSVPQAAGDLAYVIYTSGSTGQPKGVEITHRGLSNLLASMSREPGMLPEDRVLAVTTVSFDIAAVELLLPLINGAGIILADRTTACDGRRLMALIRGHRPTFIQATPATFRMLLDAGWEGDRELTVLCGGEALERDLAGRLLACCSRLFNCYGPTETTIWSTLHRVSSLDSVVPIGKPLANTQVYVLDSNGEPVPAGVTGELYIGGAGLARGYRNLPEFTRAKFVTRLGSRLYRTGDLARFKHDGVLEFLGRTDEQIKMRGFRVEPGEIEAALASHPEIAEAVVTLWTPAPGDHRLVAYLRSKRRPTAVELRKFLAATLPDYMIPAVYVFVGSFPLTPNGKIARNALPAPDRTVSEKRARTTAQVSGYVAPRDSVESRLAAIWSRLLGVERVGVRDDFFDLGGHSLLVGKLISQIEKEFGRKLEMASLFDAPTVESLAPLLRKREGARRRIVALENGGKGSPLFFVHGNPLFRHMAQHFSADRPFLTLIAPVPEDLPAPFTLEALASYHVQSMREYQPIGPYHLCGWCLDGVIAFEIARQLRLAGEEVGELILFHSRNPKTSELAPDRGGRPSWRVRLRYHQEHMSRLAPREWPNYIGLRWHTAASRMKRKVWRLLYALNLLADRRVSSFSRDMDQMMALAVRNYEPGRYEGTLTLILPEDRPISPDEDRTCGWTSVVRNIDIHEAPGTHVTMFQPPNVQILASVICEMLDGELSPEGKENSLLAPPAIHA